MLSSEGCRGPRPGCRRSTLWRRVKLSCIVHLCGRPVVIQGRATRGHCHRVRQARVLAAAASKKLGAHVCPILGNRCQRGVVHRPQAGVLTVQRHGERVLLSIYIVSKLESSPRVKILIVIMDNNYTSSSWQCNSVI